MLVSLDTPRSKRRLDEAHEAMRRGTPGGYYRFSHSAVIASLAVEQRGVTGRADSNLLDVRLDRAAAQDDSLERRRQRLAQADPLGQPTARQVGLPGRGRLPRAAGPAKRKDRRLILRRYAVARCRDVLMWPPGWWITAGPVLCAFARAAAIGIDLDRAGGRRHYHRRHHRPGRHLGESAPGGHAPVACCAHQPDGEIAAQGAAGSEPLRSTGLLPVLLPAVSQLMQDLAGLGRWPAYRSLPGPRQGPHAALDPPAGAVERLVPQPPPGNQPPPAAAASAAIRCASSGSVNVRGRKPRTAARSPTGRRGTGPPPAC